jgi:UDP-glucose 4-epimerase
MRWLITGGCGFIGTSLVRQLTAEGGHSIRVIDNLSVGTRDELASACSFEEVDPSQLSPITTQGRVELIVGDVLDADLALKATEGVDVIVHLAAITGVAPSLEDPRKDCVTNVIGTLNYLEGARAYAVKRFVFASSGAPVGECTPPLHEELSAHPVSPYGASKLAGEGYCSAYYRSYDIEAVALRFGCAYGPGSGNKNSVVAKFIKHALAKEPLQIYGSGEQTRDFIYIDDLVQSIRSAATVEGIGGEVFQIASNTETTVSELVELLVPILQEAGIEGVKVIFGKKRQGDVLRNFSDTTKAKQRLGWQSHTDLVKGLQQSVHWFVES